MATDFTINVPAAIPKGTPVPSRVVSPAKLRVAKLPFSQDLARDVEQLSEHLNALHSKLAGNATSVSIPGASSGSAGLVKPDGTTITIDANGVIHASGGVDLETNGVNNGSQNRLNLIAGANVSLTDDGAGNVTLDVTSTPNLIEVNGSPVGLAGISAAGVVIGFVMGDCEAGTNVGPLLLAPHSGRLTQCVAVVKTTDTSAPLTFQINQDGVGVFSSANTIPTGTSAGTRFTFTNLTSASLPVAQSDVFTIDILSGGADWQFTAQLE